MRAARTVAVSLVVMTTTAGAAPVVHTDTGEVRACQPLDGGDFLVGTGGGLVLVGGNGATKSVWTAADGLPGTRIDSIAVTGDELWIGTEAGAAEVRLDGNALKIVRRVEARSVRDVARFEGADYVALADAGVRKLGATGSTEVPITGAAKARTAVTALAVADGTLWAGTAAGLYRLAHGKLERVTLEPGVPADVTALHAAGHQLWIATTAGLYLRDGLRDGLRDSATVHHFAGGDLRRVARVDGAIAAAGLGTGIVRVDRGRLVAVAGVPRELVMAQAIAERGGAACAGGLDGLWLRATATAAWLPAARRAGPPSNDVSALAIQGDRLWVGTFDHGLAALDHGAWQRIADRAIDPRINALLVDRRQRLWVATAAGLSMIDRDRITQLTLRDGLPSRSVLALAELHDGRILIGTTSGAAILGDGRPVALGAKQNLEAKNVWAVAEDADGWIWLGTTTGVFRGRADDATWTRFSVATGHLRDDWVMALALRDHAVWVGTYHGGVTRLDDAGSEAPAAVALGDGWINPGGLRWIGDTLYASTMEGLRTGDGASATWSTLAGLPGRDITTAVRGGDTLWIATRRGLVATR